MAETSSHLEHGTNSEPVRGVSLSEGDLMLDAVTAPPAAGSDGTLSFRIQTVAGTPVTKFDHEHGEWLHLIVARTDGREFRHVHPTMNPDGLWSIPWMWNAPGTYRIFADFIPRSASANAVLSTTLNVAGTTTPYSPTAISTVSQVDGFTVTIDGALHAGGTSTLTATITHDGKPVTSLQPYLEAYGHLVALRDGDMAYLHTHPEGTAPTSGSMSGPQVGFMTEPPTPGRYFLYLDFQVDGRVHTAQFVTYAQPQTATQHHQGGHHA